MNEPYYRDALVTLYHGTCVPDDSRPHLALITEWLNADVLITDPPYGTDEDGHGYGRRQKFRKVGGEMVQGSAQIANDGDTRARDAALEMWGDRPALVFGSPRLPDPPIKVADRLVWDKRRPGMNSGPWRYRHESIYVTDGFTRTSDAAVSILSAFPEQSLHIHGKPLPLMVSLVSAAPPRNDCRPVRGCGNHARCGCTNGHPRHRRRDERGALREARRPTRATDLHLRGRRAHLGRQAVTR